MLEVETPLYCTSAFGPQARLHKVQVCGRPDAPAREIEISLLRLRLGNRRSFDVPVDVVVNV